MAKKRDVERTFEVHTNPHPAPLVREVPNLLRDATPEERERQERNVRALVALQKWRGKRFWKTREVVFALEDLQAFSDLLKVTYPRIRFLAESALGARKSMASGSHHPDWEPEVRYIDNLSDPCRGWIVCWLEPEGWKPKIGPTRFAPNARCILNEPRLQFAFLGRCTVLRTTYATGDTFRRKDKPLPPFWQRPSSDFKANPRVDDAEHKAFIGKAYNLVTKIATNKLVFVDTITGRAIVPPKPRGEKLWVGHHALAWCRADPRNFVGRYFRPADEAEWRSKIPKDHPDYLSDEEAYERFVERMRFERQAHRDRQRQAAEAKNFENGAKSDRKPTAKKSAKTKPPKKKGG